MSTERTTDRLEPLEGVPALDDRGLGRFHFEEKMENPVALYAASGAGAFFISLADLVNNDTAAVVIKVGNVIRASLAPDLQYAALIALLVIVLFAIALCWINPPRTRVDAFTRGFAVFALLSVSTPYSSQTLSPLSPKINSETEGIAALERTIPFNKRTYSLEDLNQLGSRPSDFLRERSSGTSERLVTPKHHCSFASIPWAGTSSDVITEPRPTARESVLTLAQKCGTHDKLRRAVEQARREMAMTPNNAMLVPRRNPELWDLQALLDR